MVTTAASVPMEIKIRIPHVAWRDGRPRYVPSPEDRALGAKGENLRHGDGPWYTAEEALLWAREKSRALQELRTQAKAAPKFKLRRPQPRPTRETIVIADILVRWFAGEQFGQARQIGKRKVVPLAKATQAYYRQMAKVAETHADGRLWAMPAAELTTKTLKRELTAIHEARGLAVARGVKSTLSAAWGAATREDLVRHNPFQRLKMEMLPPRWRAGSIEEMETLIRAADAIGRPDVGDCVMMGLLTGQRQGDRLDMTKAGEIEGRFLVRQSKGKKRGTVVALPKDPRLMARLAAGEARRTDWKVSPLHLLMNEQGRKPWTREAYHDAFSAVRAAAVAGVPHPEQDGAWQVSPCPSLKDFTDQDLRDTAVTWLALAGATIPEICAVTGHSLQSATGVLKHYLGQHPDLAKAALSHLGMWLDEKGAGL